MLLCVLFNVKNGSTKGVSNTPFFLTNLDVSLKKKEVFLFPQFITYDI